MSTSPLPHRERFPVEGIFLNSSYIHPMSIASASAVREYLERRVTKQEYTASMIDERADARLLFAELINCNVDELAWVQSTTTGENLVVKSIGADTPGAHIVTDAAHFEGSQFLYRKLSEQGVEITVLPLVENGITDEQISRALRHNTKLVAVSLVSAMNGFTHDLKSVCSAAHAQGIPVFADIIQAAGAIPVDVRELGVDFCSCSTYKWLMGDFGAAFLYMRSDRLAALQRSQYGYRQLTRFGSGFLPFDAPLDDLFFFEEATDASAKFEVGTMANAAIPALRSSLRYLLDTGVATIAAYRRPMLERLQDELPSYGYLPLTRRDSSGPLVSFARQDATSLGPALEAAGIRIQLYPNRLRVSPSVFNTMEEIEQLIAVLRSQ